MLVFILFRNAKISNRFGSIENIFVIILLKFKGSKNITACITLKAIGVSGVIKSIKGVIASILFKVIRLFRIIKSTKNIVIGTLFKASRVFRIIKTIECIVDDNLL